ncbi:hypothetical protein ACJJTC_017815, partial [Scirpophaga incertulas]
MVQCKKCKQYVSKVKEEIITCKGPCEAVYHKKCVENLKVFAQKELCEDCQKRPRIEIDPNDLSIETLLQQVNVKLDIMYKIEKRFDELKDTVEFYAEQYQTMIEFKEESEKKYKALEHKNINLEKQNMALEERILELEQKEKDKNIEIIGLEKNKDEDLMVIVKKMSKSLNLKVEDISDAKRVGKEKDINGKVYQPLVITCRNKTARDKWIDTRKSIITNEQIY